MIDQSVLNRLCAIDAPSGWEQNAGNAFARELAPFCDQVDSDAMGNVLGRIGNPDGYRILLDAHIDQVSLIVTRICEDGLLALQSVSGMDAKVLLGASVKVKTTGGEEYFGIVATRPPHILSAEDYQKTPAVDALFIDVGYPKEQAQKRFAPGDRVIFDTGFCPLAGELAASRSLDNRAGCLAILLALEGLNNRRRAMEEDVLEKIGLYTLFSSQEEVGLRGAVTGAFGIKADEAVIVDVGHGDTRGVAEHLTRPLGSGAAIGIAPMLKRATSRTLIDLAKEEEIPYTVEVMTGATGTNASSIAIAGAGVASALISIPLRYMHTPNEVVCMTDIAAVADLLCAYLIKRAKQLREGARHV